MLACRCLVNTEYDNTLVGVEYSIKNAERDVLIHFPLGYRLSDEEDEHGRRRDILLLLATLRKYSQKADGSIAKKLDTEEEGFPVEAYLTIISDYITRGYYREKETTYRDAKRGKISWGRTIKREKPLVQEGGVFYLDFVIRKEQYCDNEWITLIHKYCVYLSFLRMGWLFTAFVPEKPQMKKNDKMFKAILHDKISHTFNERNRVLFQSMLVVLGYEGSKEAEISFRYGTTSFYHVWESMIDWVYGISDKQRYFPRTIWKIGGKNIYKNPLEPDSIMPYGKNLYILDAKYYKYGITHEVGDLPDTSSIHKQITYGEYIDNKPELKGSESTKIYNAFILPYASKNEKGMDYIGELDYIGEAVSEWKENTKTYEHIEGIMLDTKKLMEMDVRKDKYRIQQLAEFIEDYYHRARTQEQVTESEADNV